MHTQGEKLLVGGSGSLGVEGSSGTGRDGGHRVEIHGHLSDTLERELLVNDLLSVLHHQLQKQKEIRFCPESRKTKRRHEQHEQHLRRLTSASRCDQQPP